MTRLVLAIVATILLVAFAFANTDHVALSFVFGGPVHVRLIFLLMVSFIAGATVPIYFALIAGARRRRRQLPVQNKGALLPE